VSISKVILIQYFMTFRI